MTARVLVVDDVAANLRLLEARLKAEYYEVALASSGPDALALAAVWSPDVILLDVMMPGMDGYEVCLRLKAQPETAHIPVVMLTALVEAPERVRGLVAGADDFLSKPVDESTLFVRLRALLRTKQVMDAWRLRAETARDLGLEPPLNPPADPAGSHALLVGHAADEAETLSLALAEDGISVETAPTEAEAWSYLTLARHDLVVLSVPLPDGDPLRFASRLRAQSDTRDLPLLLAAGPEHRGLLLRAFDLGASDYVLRPVDPNELKARVRNQIRRRRYQEKLREDLDRSLELAVTDPLTGLRNRRYARRHLDSLLRANGMPAVLLVDVDRFKPVNDLYGHAAGDAALQAVAGRLRENVRAADVVARYGGEEFVVAMSNATPEDTAAVAERLRDAVAADPVRIDAGRFPITVSIGAALARPGATVDALMAAADSALYRAKRKGRNRVEFAADEDWRAPQLRDPVLPTT